MSSKVEKYLKRILRFYVNNISFATVRYYVKYKLKMSWNSSKDGYRLRLFVSGYYACTKLHNNLSSKI